MLSIAPQPTIFLHTFATDMRKSFDGLTGLVRGTFGSDPTDGSLFLFVNKRRDRIKALWWDGDGFVLWYKRREQGTFQTVPAPEGEARVRIDSTAGHDPGWRNAREHEATQALSAFFITGRFSRDFCHLRPGCIIGMLRA